MVPPILTQREPELGTAFRQTDIQAIDRRWMYPCKFGFRGVYAKFAAGRERPLSRPGLHRSNVPKRSFDQSSVYVPATLVLSRHERKIRRKAAPVTRCDARMSQRRPPLLSILTTAIAAPAPLGVGIILEHTFGNLDTCVYALPFAYHGGP